MLKAMEKCGSKNIENIVEILSKVKPNQVGDVLDLLASHGDDMVMAIKNCKTDNIDLIEELIKSGKKVNLRDFEFVLNVPDAKALRLKDNLVWLEMGSVDSRAGFAHILDHPLEQFSSLGVMSKADLQKLLLKTISDRTPVGTIGSGGTAYRVADRYLCVVIGSNGYVVDAYDITNDVKRIKFF